MNLGGDVTKGLEKAFKKLEQLPTLPTLFTHFVRNSYKLHKITRRNYSILFNI